MDDRIPRFAANGAFQAGDGFGALMVAAEDAREPHKGSRDTRIGLGRQAIRLECTGGIACFFAGHAFIEEFASGGRHDC
ncbi:hypothetical protein U8326_15255 [Tsuneonella sp. CC-YZS046]|uniref:hypothetical protein n=1 Tax=Tsuneonella sp. CC-YZS046 TaxID=3042152 RepID=UPI002D7A2758|nr:hypothetical protein [Tsuneonella sp. CC-YZS046]WRO68283.1 hypothetical protein U8326_15255 [Tsuneonella sp. CC-YZS046]